MSLERNMPLLTTISSKVSIKKFSSVYSLFFPYRQVAEHVKSLDKSRPVTIVIAQSVDADVSVNTSTNIRKHLLQSIFNCRVST